MLEWTKWTLNSEWHLAMKHKQEVIGDESLEQVSKIKTGRKSEVEEMFVNVRICFSCRGKY